MGHTIIQHCAYCGVETYQDVVDDSPDINIEDNKYDDVCRKRTCCEQAYGRKVS